MKNTKKTEHAISMGYRIDAAPAGWRRSTIVAHMLYAVRTRKPLPLGLSVSWTIRGKVQDLDQLIQTANDGLLQLMERRIVRDFDIALERGL